MIYRLPQRPNILACGAFTQHESGLTDAEVDRVREYGDRQQARALSLYGPSTEQDVLAAVSRFAPNDETMWFFDKMAQRLQSINEAVYKYEISGFEENFSYLRYDAPAGHFNWHLDWGPQTPAPRKLSMALQLSDPSEYEGGEFEVVYGSHHARAEKGKGMLTLFPAFHTHRVTPITQGTRRAITMFGTGPNFR